jgi:hypothetical protein
MAQIFNSINRELEEVPGLFIEEEVDKVDYHARFTEIHGLTKLELPFSSTELELKSDVTWLNYLQTF